MGRFEDSGAMDEETFRQIVRTYGPTLTRYVHHRTANPSDAEDVLQETLIAASLGFRTLRDLDRVYACLILTCWCRMSC